MKVCCINYARHAWVWRKRLRKYEEACAGLYMMVNDRDESIKSQLEEIRILRLVIEDLRREMRAMRAQIRELKARAREEREAEREAGDESTKGQIDEGPAAGGLMDPWEGGEA